MSSLLILIDEQVFSDFDRKVCAPFTGFQLHFLK